MKLRSWHFTFLGFLILFLLQTYFYATGVMSCGEKQNPACPRMYNWGYAVYLVFLIIFFVIPSMLLRMEKTRKAGAVISILLGSFVLYGALFHHDSLRDMGEMLLLSLLFFAGGGFFFLKEIGKEKTSPMDNQ